MIFSYFVRQNLKIFYLLKYNTVKSTWSILELYRVFIFKLCQQKKKKGNWHVLLS